MVSTDGFVIGVSKLTLKMTACPKMGGERKEGAREGGETREKEERKLGKEGGQTNGHPSYHVPETLKNVGDRTYAEMAFR